MASGSLNSRRLEPMATTRSRSYDAYEMADVTQIKSYFAEWGCVGPEADAFSEINAQPYP